MSMATNWQHHDKYGLWVTARTKKKKHEIEVEAGKPEMKIEIFNISSSRTCEKKSI